MLTKLLGLIPFLLWFLTWSLGGWLLVDSVFRLPRRLVFGVGLALGAVMQAWFANLLGYILPMPYPFLGGALVTLALGLAFAWPFHMDKLRRAFIPASWGQVLTLILLVYIFTAIGRGLGLFDDYQNLPSISLLARGEIPPRFALDPQFRFGYHYLMLLFAAQVTRLGGLLPWNALDLTRGLFFGLTILLTYLWTERMTRSRLAAYAGAAFAACAGGTRWLLLLLPTSWVADLSRHVTMLGSAAEAVPDLARGLILPWDVNGSGPIAFPFAFINGINPPLILSHGGSGLMVAVVSMLILLLYRFWHDWRGGLVMTILLAALANISEHIYLAAFVGLGLALVIHWARTRSLKIPRDFLPWIALGSASAVFAAFQGGVLTEIVRSLLRLDAGASSRASYFTVAFALIPHPTVISGHLGLLDLTNPRLAFLAFLEIGPVFLAIPITAVWGWKMIRAHRWWEAGLVFGGVMGLASLFLQYEGTAGVTATSRLFANLLATLTLYAIPLLWTWAKPRTARIKQALISLGLVTIFGGMILFGIELIAAQKPALPLSMQEMDIQMENEYWNRLEPNALIFDIRPTRAVTIFGRYTDSHETWYQPKESWLELVQAPTPQALRTAGFDYFYFGLEDWENFTPEVQQALKDSCVKLVAETTGFRSETDFRKSWRRLVDIRTCK
jgi:hypothetical protein